MALFDFASLRRSIQSIEERLKKLRIEINDKQRQRNAILGAPLCKDDVKQMLASWVQASADQHVKSLQESLTRMGRDPRGFSAQLTQQSAPRLFGAVSGYGQEPSASDMDKALCGLFGAELVRTLGEVVDRMEWPQQGLPMSQRQAAADKIERDLAELMREEEDLMNQAAEAGITLA